MVRTYMIVASTKDGGIGCDGKLPWQKCGKSLSADMAFFKKITTSCENSWSIESNVPSTVIMGKNTWFSIPEKFRPLPNRTNIVLSRNGFECEHKDVIHATSIENALKLVSDGNVFVIGGGYLYEKMLNFHNDTIESILLTEVSSEFECDTFIDMNQIHTQFPGKQDITVSVLDFVNKRNLLDEEGYVNDKGVKYKFCLLNK
ncbi:hypothetical protein ROZALSC1DRAFT_26838 [Rozella allomycis CSF55]|uniref:Dihydrofolate reductase n=1 Tax=Rozella allomycis (strain CSF55) TaxID=988480 RepID=A0A075AYN4_ROZAC|nr:Dihydrofolate reductase domain-containing protein [Rozella allomycis CSF55]RKP21785.1 hypothetical protein ROZALSC1DRAFT_26838 [Rozella allomycis CSF55]|eukprot:EPZ35392.1 Dihydrofolate reductase domain-containing protein [Rozella allomycis CSF55]